MTFSPHSLARYSGITKLGALGLALLWTAVTFVAVTAPAPAEARGNAVFYTAELAQPASESRMVAGGVAWTCSGTTCVAAKGSNRPIRMCRKLFRKTGEIVSFTAKDKVLAEDKLTRCNA